MHVFGFFAELGKNGVPRLVIRGAFFVRLGYDAALLLRSHDNFVDPFVKLMVADHGFAFACRKDRRLVQEVGKICARKTARHARDNLKVYFGRKRFVARMHLQDLFAPLYVGQVDINLSVKASGTEQCVIENVGTVGRRHNDNSLVGLEAVHLNENLVQGLFAFVVSAP